MSTEAVTERSGAAAPRIEPSKPGHGHADKALAERLRRDAATWQAKYESERIRLAKLWALYEDAEAELAAAKAQFGLPEGAWKGLAAPPVAAEAPEVVAETRVAFEPGAEPDPDDEVAEIKTKSRTRKA